MTASSFLAFGSVHACQLMQALRADSGCSAEIDYAGAIGFFLLVAADAMGLGVAIVALLKGPRRKPDVRGKKPSGKA